MMINSNPPNKNPPPAECFSEKSTNCEVPFLKIHQQLSIHTAVGGFLDQALCSWWIFIRRCQIAVETRIRLFHYINKKIHEEYILKKTSLHLDK